MIAPQGIFFLACFAVGFFSIGLAWAIFKATNRCVHVWQLVDKTEFPSGLETMMKCGVQSFWLWPSDIPKLSRKMIILALRCDKCGAAKIFRESSA